MTDRRRGRIVVGYDGSEPSKAALRWAVDEARRRGTRVEIVHARQLREVVLTGYGTATVPLITPEDIDKEAEKIPHQALLEARAMDDSVKVIASGRRGHPAPVLVAAAAGADLLVVGCRGLGGFAGMLLGSVSHNVASHAPCPVVIVR